MLGALLRSSGAGQRTIARRGGVGLHACTATRSRHQDDRCVQLGCIYIRPVKRGAYLHPFTKHMLPLWRVECIYVLAARTRQSTSCWQRFLPTVSFPLTPRQFGNATFASPARLSLAPPGPGQGTSLAAGCANYANSRAAGQLRRVRRQSRGDACWRRGACTAVASCCATGSALPGSSSEKSTT